jgi:hypothetical protein
MPAGAPTAAAAAKGPAYGRACCKEGKVSRRVGGVSVVAPTAVPAGPPAATTAPTTHSQEAAAAA